jgi:hypothetical protein
LTAADGHDLEARVCGGDQRRILAPPAAAGVSGLRRPATSRLPVAVAEGQPSVPLAAAATAADGHDPEARVFGGDQGLTLAPQAAAGACGLQRAGLCLLPVAAAEGQPSVSPAAAAPAADGHDPEARVCGGDQGRTLAPPAAADACGLQRAAWCLLPVDAAEGQLSVSPAAAATAADGYDPEARVSGGCEQGGVCKRPAASAPPQVAETKAPDAVVKPAMAAPPTPAAKAQNGAKAGDPGPAAPGQAATEAASSSKAACSGQRQVFRRWS